jgi:hypothetical protein
MQEMGFHAEFAQEFEWFNFRETPQSLAEKGFRQLEPLTPGMFGYSILRPSLENAFYHDLFDQLTQFDIPLEGLHTETGRASTKRLLPTTRLPERPTKRPCSRPQSKKLPIGTG